jgi:hypothetical protein
MKKEPPAVVPFPYKKESARYPDVDFDEIHRKVLKVPKRYLIPYAIRSIERALNGINTISNEMIFTLLWTAAFCCARAADEGINASDIALSAELTATLLRLRVEEF